MLDADVRRFTPTFCSKWLCHRKMKLSLWTFMCRKTAQIVQIQAVAWSSLHASSSVQHKCLFKMAVHQIYPHVVSFSLSKTRWTEYNPPLCKAFQDEATLLSMACTSQCVCVVVLCHSFGLSCCWVIMEIYLRAHMWFHTQGSSSSTPTPESNAWAIIHQPQHCSALGISVGFFFFSHSKFIEKAEL